MEQYAAVQNQKAVSAYFSSKKILPFYVTYHYKAETCQPFTAEFP